MGHIDINLNDPYRKTKHSEMLMRWCREAWDELMDLTPDADMAEKLRSLAISAAFNIATDDEISILEKFHASTWISKYHVIIDGRGAIVDDFGFQIHVPTSCLTNHMITIQNTPLNEVENPRGKIYVDMPQSIIDFWIDGRKASSGYEAEHHKVVLVNRCVGAPATWAKMLEHMPVTAAYVRSNLTSSILKAA